MSHLSKKKTPETAEHWLWICTTVRDLTNTGQVDLLLLISYFSIIEWIRVGLSIYLVNLVKFSTKNHFNFNSNQLGHSYLKVDIALAEHFFIVFIFL